MSAEKDQTTFASEKTAPTVVAADYLERAADPALSEDLALALLKERDLPFEVIDQLCKNSGVMKARKVCFAIAAHPHTPRHISLKLIRELYTFDLMRYAITPGIAADLKRLADELLIARVTSISLGERISLARRGSEAVAAALLLDKEPHVWQAALENGRLTEADVVKAVLRPSAGAALVEAVCRHAKWSFRHEIRLALLRNAKTPLTRALEFARAIPPAQLRDLLHSSHLPEKVKASLRKDLESRRGA